MFSKHTCQIYIRNKNQIFAQSKRSWNLKYPSIMFRNTETNSNIFNNDDKMDVIMENEPGFQFTSKEMRKLKLWNKGVIPYYIDTVSFSDKILRDKIRSFLNNVNAITPLSFVELPTPPKNWNISRWVFFVNRVGQLGCGDHSNKNFTTKGVQRVVLGYDCVSNGGEMAEAVLAIAGVTPQHNAPNRDKFIRILEDNILPDKKYLFEKVKDN
ncbi:zinc metalloproteinase nas-14-like [Anticarsia gemmatalis]|uniref:zinc metalloproteinase nas-14-like n=1 Tax=Anticarsia gemmatalis TaxID=129554 RepID=UPI003F76DEB9